MSSHAITRTIVVAILLGAPGADSAFCQLASDQLVDERVGIDYLVDERPTSGMRFGTLTLSPTLEVMTGLDTNVFNEVEEPKSDLMTSVSPTADVRLRLGRGRAAVSGHADFVHFGRYASERSVDGFTSGGIVVPFNRVRPYVVGSFLATRQRPSYEIDARSRRREVRATAGIEVQLTPVTSVRVNGARRRIAYVGDAVFQGTWLREMLNRESRTIGIAVRHSVTPLTTVTIGAETDQDVFQFSRGRNARSRRMTATVDFAPFALISGNASLGWRAFEAADTAVPDYRGGTGSAELSYVLLGSTQFTVHATRDVEYSFEPLTPYYVLTGAGGTITQRLTASIAITATTMWYGLQFRGVTAVPRIDRHTIHSAGAFYRIGRRLRVNVNGEYHTRRSPVVGRDYRGLRSTTSLTYGM